MSQPLNLSVSLVTYYSPLQLLDSTVNSLHASLVYARRSVPGLLLSLRLIDNSGSSTYQNSVRQRVEKDWAGLFDGISYQYTGSNNGYGSAHNLGILEADSDYHLVLNPDVNLSQSALEAGLGCLLANPGVAMVNPSASNGDGVPQYLCKRYPSILGLLLRAFAPALLRRRLSGYMGEYEFHEQRSSSAICDVALMSGCCMLGRTRILQQVGGFSDHFFMYFEDFDLSLRLLPLGRLVFLPDMQIVHHGGFSARKGPRHILMFAVSGWKFFNRHGWSWI